VGATPLMRVLTLENIHHSFEYLVQINY